MALFIDTFVNRIDRKGRVSVPAPFRAALGSQNFHGIVALPAFKYAALQCAGLDWLEGLSAELGKVDLFSDAHDDMTATLFADARQLGFDSEGRIMLPDALIRHAGLREDAAFVGRGGIFEVWHPDTFAAYRAEARKRALEQSRTLRTGGKP